MAKVLLSLLAIAAAIVNPYNEEQIGPVELTRLDGSRLVMQNYAEHRATVVLFLSSRSGETDGAREKIRELTRRRGIMFVGIFPNPAENGDEVRDYCQASRFNFPCYRDPQKTATRKFDARVTPEAFLLDRSGILRYNGAVEGLSQALAEVMSDQAVKQASLPATGTPIDRPGAARTIEDPFESVGFSSEFIFEKIPGAPSHHCSSIAEAANGDLLVTWYGGSYESSDDESLFMARRKKGEKNWSRPRVLIRNPSQPVGNAVIFTDARQRLWIVWGRMEASQPLLHNTGWSETRLMYRISQDHGFTWSPDKLFPLDTTGWLPRNLPITLQSGELVLPLSDERNDNDLSFVVISRDNGASWERSQSIPNTSKSGEQPTVVQRHDGSLLALLRTRPVLLASESTDRGLTWSQAKPTEFKCPDAAISMRKLANGNILLAWNNQDNARSPLHLARSTDNGRNWSRPLMLESNPGEYSYPSIFQTSDGKIHIVYTYRRYSIKHLEFDESWLDRFERQE
jgi:predicted neuraminidase